MKYLYTHFRNNFGCFNGKQSVRFVWMKSFCVNEKLSQLWNGMKVKSKKHWIEKNEIDKYIYLYYIIYYIKKTAEILKKKNENKKSKIPTTEKRLDRPSVAHRIASHLYLSIYTDTHYYPQWNNKSKIRSSHTTHKSTYRFHSNSIHSVSIC